MHALPSHCFRSWLSCNGSWRRYGPTFLPDNCWDMAPLGKTSSKKKPENNGEMLLCFLNLFGILIGSVCWQSSGLRSWKPAQTLNFGPHSEVAWTDLISVQLSIQADWEPRDFAVDVQSKRISQVFTCFQIYQTKSWIKPTSNKWSNSSKGWELPQSFSINFWFFCPRTHTTNEGQPTRLGSMTQPCRFQHASG